MLIRRNVSRTLCRLLVTAVLGLSLGMLHSGCVVTECYLINADEFLFFLESGDAQVLRITLLVEDGFGSTVSLDPHPDFHPNERFPNWLLVDGENPVFGTFNIAGPGETQVSFEIDVRRTAELAPGTYEAVMLVDVDLSFVDDEAQCPAGIVRVVFQVDDVGGEGEGEGEGEGDKEFSFTVPSVGAASEYGFLATGVVRSADGDPVTAGEAFPAGVTAARTLGFIAEADLDAQSLDFGEPIDDEVSEINPGDLDIQGIINAPDGYLVFGAIRHPEDMFQGYLYRTDNVGMMQWAASPTPEDLPGNWTFVDAMTDDAGFAVLGTRFNGADRNVFVMIVDDTGSRAAYHELPIDGVLAEAVGFAPAIEGNYAIAANRASFTPSQALFILTQPAGGTHKVATFTTTDNVFYRSIAPLTVGGGFALAGEFVGDANFRNDVFLREVDGNGNELWSELFPEATASVSVERVRADIFDDFIVAGRDVDSSPDNEGPVTAGYLARFDTFSAPDVDRTVSRRFGPGDSNRFEDFVFGQLGSSMSVIAVGSTATAFDGENGSGGTRAYIVETLLAAK